jgi:type IV pilus assembly protein PilZ
MRVDVKGVCVPSGGEPLDVHVTDLCAGGAFLETPVTIDFGTKVDLTLELDGQPVKTSATVRWKRKGGVGVQFGLLKARDTYALTEYLAHCEPIPDSRRLE